MGIRQAVVIIHGMGEQRPLNTLNGFIRAALPDGCEQLPRRYFSRPDHVADSYEARRYLAPRCVEDGSEVYAQTEFFEYHWAHLMQGNRLSDILGTFKRLMLPSGGPWATLACAVALAVAVVGWAVWRGPWVDEGPTVAKVDVAAIPEQVGLALLVLCGVGTLGYLLVRRVPSGLKGLWLLLWGVLIWVGHELWVGRLSNLGPDSGIADGVRAVLGTGLLTAVVAFLISRPVPGWITSSFVDVVRYLDTSPRSYDVRRKIRKGVIDLLEGLHGPPHEPRYDRIIIVAHSLGSYIAYDAISYLWAKKNKIHNGSYDSSDDLEALKQLDAAGSWVESEAGQDFVPPQGIDSLTYYRQTQRKVWRRMRTAGIPWRITDLITLGSPMYFADLLYTTSRKVFDRRVAQWELPTCPPQEEGAAANRFPGTTGRWFSFKSGSRRVLYHGAPFAVVRWTNLYFCSYLWFFGDWFGGPLAPLFGRGISDVAVDGSRWRLALTAFPGAAHALYFKFPKDDGPRSPTTQLRHALDLASTAWVEERGAGHAVPYLAGTKDDASAESEDS